MFFLKSLSSPCSHPNQRREVTDLIHGIGSLFYLTLPVSRCLVLCSRHAFQSWFSAPGMPFSDRPGGHLTLFCCLDPLNMKQNSDQCYLLCRHNSPSGGLSQVLDETGDRVGQEHQMSDCFPNSKTDSPE